MCVSRKSLRARSSLKMKQFAGDRRGAVLPMLALVLVFLIVVAGAGIDFARAVNQRQAIARGLDAAMLAVARELSIRNMTDGEIKQFLDDNYDAFFGANSEGSAIPGVEIVVQDPDIDTKARRISVSASSAVPTYFIRLAGMGPEELSVSAAAQAIYPKSVEASLVVDVTRLHGRIEDPGSAGGRDGFRQHAHSAGHRRLQREGAHRARALQCRREHRAQSREKGHRRREREPYLLPRMRDRARRGGGLHGCLLLRCADRAGSAGGELQSRLLSVGQRNQVVLRLCLPGFGSDPADA